MAVKVGILHSFDTGADATDLFWGYFRMISLFICSRREARALGQAGVYRTLLSCMTWHNTFGG